MRINKILALVTIAVFIIAMGSVFAADAQTAATPASETTQAKEKACPECLMIYEEQDTCPDCGAALVEVIDAYECPDCGLVNKEGGKCPNCGTDMAQVTVIEEIAYECKACKSTQKSEGKCSKCGADTEKKSELKKVM